MTPIEKVLSRLPGHRTAGDGFKACCPSHEDRTPSLSIREASDGTVLIKCFGGCPTSQIVSDLELDMADLFPDAHERSWPANSSPKSCSQPRNFASADDAISAYGRGRPDRKWTYTDASGAALGHTLRWQTNAGKDIRPVAKGPDGWRHAAMPSPRPLLYLQALLADQDAVVYVVEGEKCVDALIAMGLMATTSAGGSQAAKFTDWTPLAGRVVGILPDNDESGRKYAETVRVILEELGATVTVLDLDGLPAGGDVADLYDGCTSDDERRALRLRIEARPQETASPAVVPADNESSGLHYQAFPVETLPPAVAAFVVEAAKAVQCDTAFVALPVLTLLGAAIGNSRRLRVKRGYDVSTVLWTSIVGASGSGKTPAIRTALALAHEHEAALKKLDTPRRFLVDDFTKEGLVPLMATNPRGVFCVPDELATLFGSIDRYHKRKGSSSSDLAFLLSCYNGVPHNVDRRTGELRHLYVERTSLWLTGGIQPGVLAGAMGSSQRESGLLARFLLACPPTPPRKFTDDEVSEATYARFGAALKTLFSLEGEDIVTLSAEAREFWRVFHDRTAEEAVHLSEDLEAIWSKLRETALRLALIMHLAESADRTLPLHVVKRAIALTEWFKGETRRVYAILAEAPTRQAERTEDDALLGWMTGRGWVTQRDVERGSRVFRGTGRTAPALQRLVECGRLEKEDRRPGAEGGPTTTVYRVPPLPDPSRYVPIVQPLQPPEDPQPTPSPEEPDDDSWTKL